MTFESIRLYHYELISNANGPGKRSVLWVQGCTLKCLGCFNHQTHSPFGGRDWPVGYLVELLLNNQNGIEGVTISGGEPLQQLQPLVELTQKLKEQSNLSILLLSGYSWTEITRFTGVFSLLDCLDVVIAGRYLYEKRLASGLVGSSNKSIHFLTNRYTLSDLAPIPEAEVIIGQNGEVVLTGISPLLW